MAQSMYRRVFASVWSSRRVGNGKNFTIKTTPILRPLCLEPQVAVVEAPLYRLSWWHTCYTALPLLPTIFPSMQPKLLGCSKVRKLCWWFDSNLECVCSLLCMAVLTGWNIFAWSNLLCHMSSACNCNSFTVCECSACGQCHLLARRWLACCVAITLPVRVHRVLRLVDCLRSLFSSVIDWDSAWFGSLLIRSLVWGNSGYPWSCPPSLRKRFSGCTVVTVSQMWGDGQFPGCLWNATISRCVVGAAAVGLNVLYTASC